MRVGLICMILSLISISLFITACSDESGTKLPPVRMDMVVADVDLDGHVNNILVDNGSSFFVKENKRGPFQNIQDVKVRAVAYYQPFIQEMEAIIYDIAPVQVIFPLTPSEAGVYRQDPVDFVRAWAGGGYLNIELAIRAKNLSKHKLAFVDNSFNMFSKNEVVLLFYHSDEGDILAASKKVLVSIPLSIYYERFNNQAFEIVFIVNTWKGLTSYPINIKSL